VKRTLKTSLVAALALCVSAGAATASLTVYDKNDAKLDFSFEAGMGTFSVKNANLGGGQDSIVGNQDDDKGVNWQEFYMKPKLAGTYSLGASNFYGEWSVVAEMTSGDGDAIGATKGGDEHLDNETAFLGWKSGKLFSALGENAIDAYFGQAPIVVADGFVMGDGSSDGTGHHPAFWFGPHSSFKRAAVLKLNTSPVRGDLFQFKTDETKSETQGYGINVEATIAKYGTLGGMFMRLTGSELDIRDGMRVFEGRYMGNPLADLFDNAYLNLEYAREFNPSSDVAVSAYAWAAEAGYTFAKCPHTPTLSYRYSFYSGDDANTANRDEAYDPMFQKAFGRGWGTWLEGEIMGEYPLINSNKRTHTVMLKAKPFEALATGLLGYRFDLDQTDDNGKRHIADELNFYADWTVNDKLLISGAVGRAWPGNASKAAGFDQKTDVFEITAIVTF